MKGLRRETTHRYHKQDREPFAGDMAEEGRRSILTRIPGHGWRERASARNVAFGRRLVCVCTLLLLRLHPPTSAAAVKWTAQKNRLGLRGAQDDCSRCARLALGADVGLATPGMCVGFGADSGLQDVCEGPMLKEESESQQVDSHRRCAVCDGLCDTWYMAHEQAHCSEECARKARRKRK